MPSTCGVFGRCLHTIVQPVTHEYSCVTGCRSGYILESTLRLRYSSQYEMRGQISQSTYALGMAIPSG
jgi:hypothetical protein